MKFKFAILVVMVLFASVCQSQQAPEAPRVAKVVLLHPPFKAPFFTCGDHAGNLNFGLGDALGTDCVIEEFDLSLSESLVWPRRHKSDGAKNEDWYGWRKEVVAPCNCKVVKIHINETSNKPGKMTPGRATSIQFENSDGTNIVYAHLRELTVEEGQLVKEGEVVGLVGNNGYSRHPHVHIGAWTGKEPLQIRFDQYKMTPQ